MELNDLLPLLSRWAHILAAITIVGGIAFMRFSLVPAAQEAGASDALKEAIRRRWARLVMLSILFLLISGFYNAAMKAIDYKLDAFYLGLMTAKILLAFVIFVLISILTGRSARAQNLRKNEMVWLNAVFVLMVAVVLMAGAMKISKQPLKPDKDQTQAAHATPLEISENRFSN
jgi:uncharacterized membrane protein